MAAKKKKSATKPPVKKSASKKNSLKENSLKKSPPQLSASKKSAVKKKSAIKMHGPRADLGTSIDKFFAKQPPNLRAILDVLRELVEEVVPDAAAALKWGMPFYTLNDKMMCALTAHKAHVNLMLMGSESAYDDPHGRLEGEGKSGRRLKLTSLEDLPRPAVRKWIRTAADLARKAKA